MPPAAILDIDGTLVDTNYQHALAWFRALREIEDRLAGWAARTQCSVKEHRADPARAWVTDESDWAAFVSADTAEREQAAIDAGLADD